MRTNWILFAFVALTLVSCNSDKASKAVDGVKSTTAEAAQKVSNTTPSANKTTAPVGPATTIEFKEKLYTYKVQEGTQVKHNFKFTNTGDHDLIISNAKGSCGCTVPQWPQEPIAPGETGEIKVNFDSKGRPGSQKKSVTLTANTSPANTVLRIEGEVIPEKKQAPKTSTTTTSRPAN